MYKSDDRVIKIFDDMEVDYDQITDLWYSWLFSRLHYFIAKDIGINVKHVLDIGCGTGFQSFLYSAIGFEVVGIDISPKLLSLAAKKAESLQNINNFEPFKPSFPFVNNYNKAINKILKAKFGIPEPIKPIFQNACAESLPFKDASFDHINCCGSVLSFCKDFKLALGEISRVLKPSGSFIIEVESKYTLDNLWTLVDWILRGKIGYEASLEEALLPFKTKVDENIKIDYPFGETSNPVYMPITLFTRSSLYNDLTSLKLKPIEWRRIHSVTNFIPSTILDSSNPTRGVTRLFSVLSKIEEAFPYLLPGCSHVVYGKKTL
jgi:ubiquinone/menaquinone biosynthesis C-methylase UbiE